MAAEKDTNKPAKDENLLAPAGQGPLLWFALILIPVVVALYMALAPGKAPEAVAVPAVVQEAEALNQTPQQSGSGSDGMRMRGRAAPRSGQ